MKEIPLLPPIKEALKSILKVAILARPIRKVIRRLNRIVVANSNEGVFARFDDNALFKRLLHGDKNLAPNSFPNKSIYILTDRPCSERLERRLGPAIHSLDNFSPDQIANSVFYIYFLCDSDALPLLQKIATHGGTYVPHLSFDKTEYRFTDRSAYNAMQKTWAKGPRVSHLTPAVHENICEALSITRGLEGDYVEVGVFLGGSALTAINFIEEMQGKDVATPARKVWMLDTYDGFNYETAHRSSDAIWAGTHQLFGTEKTIAYISETLGQTHVPYELVAANICDDPIPREIKRIAVANIDVDMYEPTLAALHKVSDLIVPGGIIICEDPASTPGLYGAFQAMEEFLQSDEGPHYYKIFKHGQYFLLKLPA